MVSSTRSSSAGLKSNALGGVAIAFTLMFLSYSITYGTMRAVKVRTAFAVGEGRPADGVRYATVGSIVGLGIGFGVWVLGRDISGLLTLLRIDTSPDPTSARLLRRHHLRRAGDVRDGRAREPPAGAQRQTVTPALAVGIAGNVLNGGALLRPHLRPPGPSSPRRGRETGSERRRHRVASSSARSLVFLARDHRRPKPSDPLPIRPRAPQCWPPSGSPPGFSSADELLAFNAFTAVLGNIGGCRHGGASDRAHDDSHVVPPRHRRGRSLVHHGRALARTEGSRQRRTAHSRAALKVDGDDSWPTCGIVFGLPRRPRSFAFTSDTKIVDDREGGSS